MVTFDRPDYRIETFDGSIIYGDNVYIDDYYMGERWAFIDNIRNYMVSDHARVWSQKSQMFLKLKKLDRKGHLGVCLRENGEAHYAYIHRLMAKAFIPNPDNLPIVRHLDDDPTNNDLDNLAWGTQKDNARDCLENGNAYYPTDADREKGFQKTRIPVKAINLITSEEVYFRSQTDAGRELGIPQANIWKVLNGIRPHAHQYWFEYMKGGVN